jgi:hypothetical protein
LHVSNVARRSLALDEFGLIRGTLVCHDTALLIHEVRTLRDTSNDNAIGAWILTLRETATVSENGIFAQFDHIRPRTLAAEHDRDLSLGVQVAEVSREAGY